MSWLRITDTASTILPRKRCQMRRSLNCSRCVQWRQGASERVPPLPLRWFQPGSAAVRARLPCPPPWRHAPSRRCKQSWPSWRWRRRRSLTRRRCQPPTSPAGVDPASAAVALGVVAFGGPRRCASPRASPSLNSRRQSTRRPRLLTQASCSCKRANSVSAAAHPRAQIAAPPCPPQAGHPPQLVANAVRPRGRPAGAARQSGVAYAQWAKNCVDAAIEAQADSIGLSPRPSAGWRPLPACFPHGDGACLSQSPSSPGRPQRTPTLPSR